MKCLNVTDEFHGLHDVAEVRPCVAEVRRDTSCVCVAFHSRLVMNDSACEAQRDGTAKLMFVMYFTRLDGPAKPSPASSSAAARLSAAASRPIFNLCCHTKF